MRCREIFSLFQQPPHHGVPPAHQPALRARRQVQLGRLRLRAQEELRPPHRRRHGQVAAAVGEAKVRHHPRGAARRLSDAEVSVVYAEEELEFAFSRLSHEIGLMPPLDMILWPTHSEFFTRLILYGPIRFDLEMVSLLIDTKSSFQFFFRDDFVLSQDQPASSNRVLKGVGRKQDTWLGFKEDIDSSTMRWPKELKNSSSKEGSAPKKEGESCKPH